VLQGDIAQQQRQEAENQQRHSQDRKHHQRETRRRRFVHTEEHEGGHAGNLVGADIGRRIRYRSSQVQDEEHRRGDPKRVVQPEAPHHRPYRQYLDQQKQHARPCRAVKRGGMPDRLQALKEPVDEVQNSGHYAAPAGAGSFERKGHFQALGQDRNEEGGGSHYYQTEHLRPIPNQRRQGHLGGGYGKGNRQPYAVEQSLNGYRTERDRVAEVCPMRDEVGAHQFAAAKGQDLVGEEA